MNFQRIFEWDHAVLNRSGRMQPVRRMAADSADGLHEQYLVSS